MVNTRSTSQNRSNQNSNEVNSDFHDAQSSIPNTHALHTHSSTLSIKLPQFWTSCPETWFIQTELTFTLKNITDDTTKYQLVIISLPEEVLNKIVDIIHNPPQNNKYDHIKNTILERFSMNEDARLEKLLNDSEIGDRKPSEFFRDLSALAISNSMVNNNLLIKLWMRKLPPTIQMHLTVSNLTSINEKLTLADKIYGLFNKSQISSVSTSPTNLSNNQLFENLVQVTSNLAGTVDKLSQDVSEIRNSNSFNRNNNKFPTANNNDRRSNRRNLCWYHWKFGDMAQKCISPCSFIPNTNTRNLN